jgi:hypothetical protein
LKSADNLIFLACCNKSVQFRWRSSSTTRQQFSNLIKTTKETTKLHPSAAAVFGVVLNLARLVRPARDLSRSCVYY